MTGARVFVLDNYDSFTFNIVQLLGRVGAEVTVARNDEVSVDDVRDARPDAIVFWICSNTTTPSGYAVSPGASMFSKSKSLVLPHSALAAAALKRSGLGTTNCPARFLTAA